MAFMKIQQKKVKRNKAVSISCFSHFKEMAIEKLRVEAIKKIHKQMKEEFQKGREDAYQAIYNDEIDLQRAEELCSVDEPYHYEGFEEKTKIYVKGFILALNEILKEARQKIEKVDRHNCDE